MEAIYLRIAQLSLLANGYSWGITKNKELCRGPEGNKIGDI
jgi:hypothetical protein